MNLIGRYLINLRSILLCWLFVSLIPAGGHAYYKSIDETKAFDPIISTVVNKKDRINTGIGVYENGTTGEYSKGKLAPYPPAKSRFAPLDVIDLQRTLPLQKRSLLSSKNQVSQLIYANLKLKQLVEEYKKLQANLKKIHRNINNADPTTDSGAAKTSFQKIRMTIELDRQEVIRIVNNQDHVIESSNHLISLSEFVKRKSEGLAIAKAQSMMFSENLFGNADRGNDLIRANGDEQSGFDESNKLMKKNGRRDGHRAKKQAPGILSFFGKVVKYLLKHKLEGIFYVFVMTTIFFIMATLIRH